MGKHKHRKHKSKKKQKPEKHTIQGKISIAEAGFGFVTAGENDTEYFIPPKYVKNALHGDIVEIVEIDDPFRKRRQITNRGPVAKITAIVERGRSSIVGELIAGHKVRPLQRKFPEDIKVSGSLCGASRGDWVEVDLHFAEDKKHEVVKATIKRVIGKCGVIENDLQAVIAEYELLPPYTENQENDASLLESEEIEREDLTNRFCITVDPQDAKDRDDAISLIFDEKQKLWELGVHIADVAAWVRAGSSWDREAVERAFTAYLPGNTLPMLPKSLTALTSLTAERHSLSHSVLMWIDPEKGEIVKSRRCHGLINIDANLNFDEVDAFIDGTRPDGWDDTFADNLQKLVGLVRLMRQHRRKKEAFLELATTEIRVQCDDLTHEIKGLKREVQTEADTLVEDCMLAANTAVAIEMLEKKLPAVYRIHPEPDPEKLEEFCGYIHDTFGFYPGDLSSRIAINQFLRQLPDDHTKPVIINLFLRTLPRASYSEECEFHFGLGKGRYLHFTSPIRRYPDLLVHQQLWAHDTNGKLRSNKTMSKLAASCTEKEMINDEAYYAANDRLKLHYLNMLETDQPMHEGIITRISSAGMLVDITDLGIFGFVEREALAGSFRKRAGRFLSNRDHQEYSCGDFIFLRLERVDLIRGRAMFRPVV